MSRHFRNHTPHYQRPDQMKWLTALYNTPEVVTGYSVPQIKQVVASIMQNQLREKDEQAIWDFWERLWRQGRTFEEKSLAVTFWSDRKNFELACRFHEPLLGWAADLTNWAHSDGLSSVYVRFLETLGKPVDATLQSWNASGNPWLRRQSIVSLLYYSRQRKKPPSSKRVLGAVEPLLNDEHYYVQKGVGWTLREVYQLDAGLTTTFIEKHLHAIRPAAYHATVEKVPLQLKDAWRKKRAQRR